MTPQDHFTDAEPRVGGAPSLLSLFTRLISIGNLHLGYHRHRLNPTPVLPFDSFLSTETTKL